LGFAASNIVKSVTDLHRISEHRVTFKLGDYIQVYETQLAKIDYIFVHELEQRLLFVVICPVFVGGLGKDRILDLPLVYQTRDHRIVGLPAIGARKPYIVDLGQYSGKDINVLSSNVDPNLGHSWLGIGQEEGSSILVHCDWELHFL
jgi:hypothetical protein